eukprot:IDg4801t1
MVTTPDCFHHSAAHQYACALLSVCYCKCTSTYTLLLSTIRNNPISQNCRYCGLTAQHRYATNVRRPVGTSLVRYRGHTAYSAPFSFSSFTL